MDVRPGSSGDGRSDQPWLAYAQANGMMHTFENVGRTASLSAILSAAHDSEQPHYQHQQQQQQQQQQHQQYGEPMLGLSTTTTSASNGASSMRTSESGHGNGQAGGSLSRRSAFLSTVDPAQRRRIEAAQVYLLDYYVDHLTYIANRRVRLERFKAEMRRVQVSAPEVQQSWHHHRLNESSALRRRRNRTREREFDILAQIGQGGFGRVFLARKRDTGEVCALKKMDKQLLVRLNEVQHILTERDILRTSRSEWLVKLLYAFQDPHHLYLAMEFVPGGDIRSLLIHNELFRHPVARFYIAEMLVAVAALHSFGYFHRDLKPENFLVDARGHVKLTDFGLSHGHLSRPTLEAMRRKLDRVKDREFVVQSSSDKRSLSKFAASRLADQASRAFSIVGSPDYMAPEILYTSLALDRRQEPGARARAASAAAAASGSSSSDPPSQRSGASQDPLADGHLGYDFRVDYWSLGCILYEFYASYSPFTGPTADDVWRNVYHWEEVLQRPDFPSREADDNLTPEAWSLIASLVCHRDIRLSSLAEIAKHSYFRGMDMLRLRETQTPPFVPALRSDADNRHFDDFDDPDSMAAYKDVNSKWKDLDSLSTHPAAADIDPAAFLGFTYCHNRHSRFV
ncbi:serine/threonine-protein kinase dbf2 [Coemansia javaensis]|uniref:non-specific serine/threonine protein kinase n=1 Tax=Coemansia javaensis TaxID=2761396 RepID=A0A9W8LJR6_9FUNG|nr:serine/threonine-protein kinase dbf2 [Coemansia javaensis]